MHFDYYKAYSFCSGLDHLGDSSVTSLHQRYQDYYKRVASFKQHVHHFPINTEELAAAGFYSEGRSDKVRCFWCDGALETWTKHEDPWIEHAK